MFTLVLVGTFYCYLNTNNLVFAAETSPQKAFIEVALLIVHFIVYLSWIMIGIIGPLLSNDLLMHPNVVPTLKLLWVIIRNLVNIMFVGVFIFEGFKAIFNVGEDSPQSGLGTTIIQSAIALIIVNFSFTAVKLLVDASTVATHAAFSLNSMLGTNDKILCTGEKSNACLKIPYSIKINQKAKTAMQQTCTGECPETKKQNWAKMVYFSKYTGLMGSSKTDEETLKKLNYLDEKKDKWDCINNPKCTTAEYLKELEDTALIHVKIIDYTNDFSVNTQNIVPIIAQNLLPLEKLLINSSSDNLGVLAMEILFSSLLSLIMLVAFIALVVVLLIRIAVLWVAFILSPLLAFAWHDFFGLGYSGEIQNKMKAVVKQAFIPAIFGLVLSVTVVIISQLQYTDYDAIFKGDSEIILDQDSVFNSTHPLFGFLLMLLVVVMFWKGIMWSIKGEFTEKLVEKITGGVGAAGSFLKDAAMNANWLPIYTGSGGVEGKQSPRDIINSITGTANRLVGLDPETQQFHENVKKNKYAITSGEGKKLLNEVKNNSAINVTSNVNKIFTDNPGLEDKFDEAMKNKTFNDPSFKTLINNLAIKVAGGEAQWNKINAAERVSLQTEMMEKIIAEKSYDIPTAKRDYAIMVKTLEDINGMKAIDKSLKGLNDQLSNNIKLNNSYPKWLKEDAIKAMTDEKYTTLVTNLNKIIEAGYKDEAILLAFLNNNPPNSNVTAIITALKEGKEIQKENIPSPQ